MPSGPDPLTRTEGDDKPLRWLITRRTEPNLTQVVDLTGATITLNLVDKAGASVTSMYGVDISASVTSATAGTIDLDPTAGMITDMTAAGSEYAGQLHITGGSVGDQKFPSDRVDDSNVFKFRLIVNPKL